MTLQNRQPTDGIEELVPRINASVGRGTVIKASGVLNAPKLLFASSLSKSHFSFTSAGL